MNLSIFDYLMPTINMVPPIETTLVSAAPARMAPKAPQKARGQVLYLAIR